MLKQRKVCDHCGVDLTEKESIIITTRTDEEIVFLKQRNENSPNSLFIEATRLDFCDAKCLIDFVVAKVKSVLK